MKIVADKHIPYVKEYFSSYGELILKPGRTISTDDVKDADMLLVRSITRVDKQLLTDSKVKFVGSITAGADHLETTWLTENDITWRVASGFNAPPVADYIVSIIAALQRKGLLLSPRKKRAAVIGVGNIGRQVAERLKLFNFDVVLCDPFRAEQESDFTSVPLNELTDLDLISLHVPLTKSGPHPTYHFINKDFLSRQKLGCILLNASRGSVINSDELLEYGTHLHWCFDVWEHEPKINRTVFENAFIATPHIAGYSVQSKIRGIDMIYNAACDANMIQPQAISPVPMPEQRLEFAGENHHWQDLVLGIFNPLIMTALMHTRLSSDPLEGHIFDEMRNQFNYRHEFSATKIAGVTLSEDDEALVTALGITLE